MSRTIRRKGGKNSLKYYTHEADNLKSINGILHYFNPSYGWVKYWLKKYQVLTPEQFIAKKTAIYHGDSFRSNAPARFRRNLTRNYCTEMNQRLHKAIVDGTEEDLIIDKNYHTANWEYL
jgi:hypothetical protein